MTVGHNPTTDRSKLGTKRHILTDKKGIPLSAVISSASTHDIKLVIDDVVDNSLLSNDDVNVDVNCCHHINLNWEQEEDCNNIYVLTKHTILNLKNRN